MYRNIGGKAMFNILTSINKSVFGGDLKNIFCSMNIDNADGSAIRKNEIDAYLCAIGEAYERKSLLQYNVLKDKNFSCFSLLDNSVQNFSLNFLKEKSIFFDSCSCAAHTNSYNCIKNAFFEFMERQSFIF